MFGPELIETDPRELHVPGSRRDGADLGKLTRQLSRFGSSIENMPPIWAYRGQDGRLQIFNGVTRASRAAKYAPGQLVPVEVVGELRVDVAKYPTIEETLS